MSLEECRNCSLQLTNVIFFLICLLLKMPNFPHPFCEWPPGQSLICTDDYECVCVCVCVCAWAHVCIHAHVGFGEGIHFAWGMFKSLLRLWNCSATPKWPDNTTNALEQEIPSSHPQEQGALYSRDQTLPSMSWSCNCGIHQGAKCKQLERKLS